VGFNPEVKFTQIQGKYSPPCYSRQGNTYFSSLRKFPQGKYSSKGGKMFSLYKEKIISPIVGKSSSEIFKKFSFLSVFSSSSPWFFSPPSSSVPFGTFPVVSKPSYEI
jgi:hypothetical protein